MFDKNRWLNDLTEQLKKREKDLSSLNGQHKLLFQTELGLRLLEILDLQDEPITVLWVVLGGLPIPDRRLQALTDEQRMAAAVARILLPFSSRFGWEDALREYGCIPEIWRCYQIRPRELDKQLVANIRITNHRQEHIDAYDRVLHHVPHSMRTSKKPAQAGNIHFPAFLRGGGKETVGLELPQETVDQLKSSYTWAPSFRQCRDRAPIEISYSDLQNVARLLDERQDAKGQAGGWSERVKEHIHYRALQDHKLQEVNTIPLKIDRMTHVVGMVGSGKSTLMKLIAAHKVLLGEPDQQHITLIVGSTILALEWADELNRLLADGDTPVAVPILGRTERARHLREYYGSKLKDNSEWVLRWLNTACPLLGLASTEQLANLSDSVLSGREPCESISASSSSQDKTSDRRLCPFFHNCPSQQTYRDMIVAPIWITTPGGLSSSSIPLQVDDRGIKLGELIYEHSDLVIIDEVDTVLEWFDNEYAKEIPLRGRSNAIFNLADPIAAKARTERIFPYEQERWTRAENYASLTTNNMLRHLSRTQHAKQLRDWIGGRYFTAFTLFERLARRMCGLQDWSPEEDLQMDASTRQNLEQVRGCFDEVLDRDPLAQKYGLGTAEERLITLMNKALLQGIDGILEECELWIDSFVPDIDTNLQSLNALFAAEARPLETKQTLALRLAFAVNVAVLDYSLRIVFYEWYSQPEEITDELDVQLYRRIRLSFSDILPIPPIGRVFGTYYVNNSGGEDDADAQDILSRFEYSNIGRWYVVNYHNLLGDLGLPGPNVLAMSATSWLPDSTRWHLDIVPHGILEPNPDHFKAISDSTFTYLPQTDMANNPLSVSGVKRKNSALKEITRSLIREHTLWNKYLNLQQLSIDFPEMWDDRARLLLIVNSYEQAEAVAATLSRDWPGGEEAVFFLHPSQQNHGEELVYFHNQSIRRSDIETFAETLGHILVAPMNAIGRGYNILNQHNKAAFGAIYFLIRTMSHPFDVPAVAAELNCRTFQWCNDGALEAWKEAQLISKGIEFRKYAKKYWRRSEMRRGYKNLSRIGDFSGSYNARRDLAATTLGRIVQTSGRLVRGGVPFHAYLVDAEWAPKSARWKQDGDELDSPDTSLLAAMSMLLAEYVDEDTFGCSLYAPFEDLLEIPGLHADMRLPMEASQ